MKIISLTLLILSLLTVIYFSLITLSNVITPVDENSTKYASSQDVDYQVTFSNMESYNDEYVELKMKFDTHTIELDEIIKKENITISINDNNVSTENIILELSGSGHHVSYMLKIKLSDIDLNINDIEKLMVSFDFDESKKEIEWDLEGYLWGDNS